MVQISLLALAVFLGNLAYGSWRAYAAAEPNAAMDEVVALAVVTLASAAGCLWMGLRTIRGPQPPSLD